MRKVVSPDVDGVLNNGTRPLKCSAKRMKLRKPQAGMWTSQRR